MDEVAGQIGARPDLLRLLWRDPELAIKCYLGPCLPAQYRLQGPRPWPHAARYIKDTMTRTLARHQPSRHQTRHQPTRHLADGGGSQDAVSQGPTDATASGMSETGLPSKKSKTGGLCFAPGTKSEGSVNSESLCPSWWSWWRWSRASVVYLLYVVVVCACCLLWVGGSLWGQAENLVSGNADLANKLKPHCYGNPCF